MKATDLPTKRNIFGGKMNSAEQREAAKKRIAAREKAAAAKKAKKAAAKKPAAKKPAGKKPAAKASTWTSGRKTRSGRNKNTTPATKRKGTRSVSEVRARVRGGK